MNARHARPLLRPLLPLLGVIGLAACATNPVTGEREFSLMSEAQEIQIGQELDQEVRREMGLYDDPELQAYVQQIGLRLARSSQRPNLPWHFAIVDVPAVNAFALPGGYIYLTRGIMAYLDDEAELAGVLGHEIGHVTARHAAQAYTRATSAGLGLTLGSIFFPEVRPFSGLAETGLGLLFLKYGRDDELQSDRLGAEYAVQNGWDPAGVPDLMTTLSRISEETDRRGIPNWASTHPHPEDRLERIWPIVNQLKAGIDRPLEVNRTGYLRRVEGMVFGDNPEEGVIRGNAFLHPELRFGLEYPEGWTIQNSKTQVVAKAPGTEAYILLQLAEQPRGRNLEEVAMRGMANAGFRLLEGAGTQINGLGAFVGTYQGRMSGLGDVVTRVAHIDYGRNIFVVAGLASPADYRRLDGEFSRTIRSFRPLSASEAGRIRPNRVDLYTVRPGDTWESIAQRAGQANVTASTLAIMNNSAVNEAPESGRQIKVVVAG